MPLLDARGAPLPRARVLEQVAWFTDAEKSAAHDVARASVPSMMEKVYVPELRSAAMGALLTASLLQGMRSAAGGAANADADAAALEQAAVEAEFELELNAARQAADSYQYNSMQRRKSLRGARERLAAARRALRLLEAYMAQHHNTT
jgi:hypothetical protein